MSMVLKTVLVNREGHPDPIVINVTDKLKTDKVVGEKKEVKKEDKKDK